jgi:tetratricopeptide (TPR) repeat protein
MMQSKTSRNQFNYFLNTKVLFYNRGLTYAQLGMFDKAIPDLNQAINLKPNNYDAYFVLRIYVEMDEIDKAIFNLNKAIELNPQNANYYVFRGAVQCDSGNRKEGREDLLKAIDLDGNGNDGQMAEYMLNNLCTLP